MADKRDRCFAGRCEGRLVRLTEHRGGVAFADEAKKLTEFGEAEAARHRGSEMLAQTANTQAASQQGHCKTLGLEDICRGGSVNG